VGDGAKEKSDGQPSPCIVEYPERLLARC